MLHIRRQFQFIAVAFLLVLAARGLHAQQMTVEYAHPFKARALEGKVLLKPSEGVSDVLVEECTSDWKTVIQKTHTDSNGHFVLEDSKIKGTHYIRLSAPGMNTTMFRVHVAKSAPKAEVSIKMSVAT
jgi:hypothetical protein